MKAKDSTEKDIKAPTDSRAGAAPEADRMGATTKELTDEQLEVVVGGIVGQHIGTNVAKKQ